MYATAILVIVLAYILYAVIEIRRSAKAFRQQQPTVASFSSVSDENDEVTDEEIRRHMALEQSEADDLETPFTASVSLQIDGKKFSVREHGKMIAVYRVYPGRVFNEVLRFSTSKHNTLANISRAHLDTKYREYLSNFISAALGADESELRDDEVIA